MSTMTDMRVTQLAGALGAEVRGISLADATADADNNDIIPRL